MLGDQHGDIVQNRWTDCVPGWILIHTLYLGMDSMCNVEGQQQVANPLLSPESYATFQFFCEGKLHRDLTASISCSFRQPDPRLLNPVFSSSKILCDNLHQSRRQLSFKKRTAQVWPYPGYGATVVPVLSACAWWNVDGSQRNGKPQQQIAGRKAIGN
ncbi:hypothetical protein OPV22_007096 [Ensete ventricosum]|uniref:Uncharacterized protein n=1 Tax=Ensete ventricosum TaxID=4639 RepID=A0AAV8RSJ3_ENSVE|nr:hypothetical protein OPV22_007096 [Ensete ventricosum]